MVRRWWLAVVVLAAVVWAGAATVMAVAVNVWTHSIASRGFPGLQRHPLPWTVGATAAVAAASLLVWAAQRKYVQEREEMVPAEQKLEPWAVDRPAEVDQIVAALRRSAGAAGITTAVHGAGSGRRRWRRWCARTGGCGAGSGAGCTG